MHWMGRACAPWIAAALLCGTSLAATYRIDGDIPGGADCAQFGVWDAPARTCRIVSSVIHGSDTLRIESATVEIVGTFTNEGTLDNRGTIVVNGFLNNTDDLVNFWDGTMIIRGRFFSHFMYNFGGLTNEPTGTIEFELHLENNAPLMNQGHIDLMGNFFNITGQRFDNLGSLAIAPSGLLSNGGTVVQAGSIENAGSLQNDAEWITHCDSVFSGNEVQGDPATGAQSLHVARASMEWCPIEGAQGYDVVEGDLGLLLTSGGDFSVATTHCRGSNLAALTLNHDTEPESGQGLWVLVRADGVSSADFDTVFTSQAGSRVLEISGSPGACP